ncbi:MAG: transglycosylase SLT domain-containing protein [Nitrospiraceae bacterium]|nr:MAG: transglycosylase SLT domain-containing protein [Nitrospiraceae bacterium]
MLFISLPAAGDAAEGTVLSGNGAAMQDRQELTEGRFEKAAAVVSSYLSGEARTVLQDIVDQGLPEKGPALVLLGRMERERGDLEQAAHYLSRAVGEYPLLRDYALKLLIEVYQSSGQHDKVVEAARRIENSLLLKEAGRAEIAAFLASERTAEAEEALKRYVEQYPDDWESRFTLAGLLKAKGEKAEAVKHLKDIYLNAVPLSSDAWQELEGLNADVLTTEEALRRAGHLYKKNNFSRAEAAYKEVFGLLDDSGKQEVTFLIGMCQFRQKQYGESAGTFALLESPDALFWEARSYYRRSERESFNRTRSAFRDRYPGDERLSLMYLMDADELMRNNMVNEAEAGYREVLELFPDRAEDALWGLGWLHFNAGSYHEALGYFSRLAYYEDSSEYYKYLYWGARSEEKLASECRAAGGPEEEGKGAEPCRTVTDDPFRGLPADDSYYGHLIAMRSGQEGAPAALPIAERQRPAGERYERIEALILTGLREDALAEIGEVLKEGEAGEEFFYLGSRAMELGEYGRVIYYAEPRKDREFLPYSYPLGYWSVVKPAADSMGVDAHLIAAVIREESRYNPSVTSWAGAVGLMQVMPATARRLKDAAGVSVRDNADLQDPGRNIALGTYYLAQLIQEFREIPLALAAYNAGENLLKKWLGQYASDDMAAFVEHIPYSETRRYVKKVMKSYWQYRTLYGWPAPDNDGRPTAG